jgi:uncharacterized DUF497 family protein
MGSTVVVGNFEWDSRKAEENLHKHGVSFEEALTAFEDPHSIVIEDDLDPDRFVVLGFSVRCRLLFVVYVERTVRTRIISARKATIHEQRRYADRA